MKVELVEANAEGKLAAWEMWQEIGPGENGFGNGGYHVPRHDLDDYIRKLIDASRGIGLPPNRVPQTTLWFYVEGRIVGFSKLRPTMNDALRKHGGNIGFCIRPSERGRGFGIVLLAETLKVAAGLGLKRVLLTCDETNVASRRVIERNGGALDTNEEGICRYWIEL